MNLVARAKSAYSKTRFANPDSAARHVSLIAGGTVLAQAVGILTMPIVSRIYSPSDYGIMAVYTSVLAILTELSGFRYYLAIPLPKDERYAKALVVLSLGIQITFVLLLSALLFFAGENILIKLSMPQLTPYRLLLPIGLLAAGSYIVLTQWAIREKLFSTIARTKITQSLSGAFAKIALGLMGVRPLGLLIGAIVAQGGGITTLSRSLLKKKGVPRPRKGEVRRVALRYWKFPVFSTWTGLINTFGRQFVPILLVTFYNPKTAGLFAMAQSLLQVPAVFIGSAIGQVFLQRASAARFDGSLKDLSLNTYKLLLRFGLFPILMISLFSPPVFAVVLGERWLEAGSFARVLAPWLAMVFAYSPMSVLFSILDRQGTGLLFEIIYIAFRVISFWFGSLFGGPVLAVGLFSLTGLIVLLLKMVYILSIAGNSVQEVLWTNLVILAETALLLFFPLAVLAFNLSVGYELFSIALSTLAYLFINWLTFRKI